MALAAKKLKVVEGDVGGVAAVLCGRVDHHDRPAVEIEQADDAVRPADRLSM